MTFADIIELDDILISEDVITEYFCCDYSICKGQCCISGDCGAPLKDGEVEKLRAQYPLFEDSMSVEGRKVVEHNGFACRFENGKLYTPLLPDSKACVFSHFEKTGNCLCAIEMQGCRKPVSCSLYPIRIEKLSDGIIALNYHKWSICKCAREKGAREDIRVYQFLRDPLTLAFGESFYERLNFEAEKLLSKLGPARK